MKKQIFNTWALAPRKGMVTTMFNFKKIFILVICISLLIPITTSCIPQSSEVSVESNDVSDTISLPQTDPNVKADIDSLYVGEVNRNSERVMVTKSKNYTTSVNSGDGNNWIDTGTMLTDGIIGDSNLYKEPVAWVGFTSSNLDIIVDLGEQIEGICEFETSHVFLSKYAINLIRSGSVSISNDGVNYISIGNLTLNDIVKDEKLYTYTLSLKEGIKATHIKYSFKRISGWGFISEVAAYKYEGKLTNTEFETLYPECNMPQKLETEKLWKSSEPGYNTKHNLLLGLQPQIFAPTKLEHEFMKNNSPIDCGLLTNGIYASSNSYTDSQYFHMNKAIERTFVFDLTKTSSISGYKFSFCHDEEIAVNLTSTITLFVSEDGKEWYQIERITDILSNDKVKCTVDGNLKSTYKCRFVGITMPVHTHLYCDEIEIIGKKSLSGAISATKNGFEPVSFYPNKYASSDMLSDVHDMILMYNLRELTDYKTEELNKGLITVDESLSYVAYRDNQGEILDYMADSYLYLPFSTVNQNTADGWKKYIDNTFTKKYNIDALNIAVGKANQALGNNDYKVKVFLSILRPNLSYDDDGNSKVFGDLDNNGKNEDFTKLNDRIKCIQWQIDENLRKFEEGNYNNLELAGFYWYEEQISYSDPHELKMIDYTVKYVHGKDFPLIWIPYFKSSGFYDWNALDFDVACMQPNYFWKGYGNYIEETAQICKALGMCVEFEIDSDAISTNIFRKNYKAYLKGGIDYGYMKDTIHMYYNGGGHGALYEAYLSQNAFDRSIYDDTYKFIKGTLSYKTPTVPCDQKFNCEINKKITNQKIQFEGENTYLVLSYAPKYGALTFSSDGTFTYIPTKGFRGEDSFYIISDNDYAQSELVKVTINVK